ncbi:MAG: laccase domain-containing protein [bacterium]|nr:laccase domain-containing protein [bacterium]
MIRFESLEAVGVRVAAFTGTAEGDCGLRNPAGQAAALAARKRACASLGVASSELVCAQQVHGTKVAVVSRQDLGRGAASWDDGLPETDGLITRDRGVPLAILVADCVPLFLADGRTGAVGLIHAGREGTRSGIAKIAVDAMRRHFGCRADDIHAVVGPSAGPAAYEVSAEMADAWRSDGLPASGRLLDLWQANADQVVCAGVPMANIHVSGMCTIGDRGYYSYRCGDATARNMGVVML